MSALPINSPIQRLDFDILWCIVKINADVFNYDGALETTLATSQVCHDWRNFMLSTTSLWAHIIDLEHPLWYTDDARLKLIRRSGTALLWIKTDGPIPTNGIHFHHFAPWARRNPINILDTVAENWERIQKLEVATNHFGHEDKWSLLHLPAPHLELFRITFPQQYSSLNNLFSACFGGSAPRLRELRFTGHRSNFAERPLWMHQLRSLELTVALTVSEILEVLMVTKDLVNLQLNQILADRTTSTFFLVSLPKLAHLHMHLTATLTAGAVFLDHICIPPDCSLNLSVHSIHHREIVKERTFAAVIRTISTCAQASFKHHAPQFLCLTISPQHFTLETATRADGHCLKFCMELVLEQVFPKQARAALLSEFSLPCFSEVTALHFGISNVNCQVPQISTFMACLTSVTAITTDKWSLPHLNRAQAAPTGADTGPRRVFSTLKILHLRALLSSRADKSQFDSSPDPVSKFVMARIAYDHPITTIDFTEDTLDVLPDMEFLQKAVGLKVRWRPRGVPEIHEYVCGMGALPNPVSGSTSR